MSSLGIIRPETVRVRYLERNSPVLESSAAHKITNTLSTLHTWTRQMFVYKRQLHSHKNLTLLLSKAHTEGHVNYST